MRAAAPVAAFLIAFLLGGVVIWLLGRSPLAAFEVYVSGPLRTPGAPGTDSATPSPCHRPVVLFSRHLEHRAGQFVIGAVWRLVACDARDEAGPRSRRDGPYAVGGALWTRSAFRNAVRVNDLTTWDAGVAQLILDYLVRGLARSEGLFRNP
jgi:simple sugar transport system permease protein